MNGYVRCLMARFSIPLRMAKTLWWPTGQTSLYPIAGRSLHTCGLYSAAKTQRWPMSLRTGARNWRNNERAFPHYPDTRRRILREQSLCRSLIAPRIDCHCSAGPLRRGRIFKSTSIQLFVALCIRVFLHALRGLLFLDDCASCHRCRLVSGGAAPVGKHCSVAGRARDSFCADPSPSTPSVFVDGYPAWCGTFAGCEARLSQLVFLPDPRRCVPGLFLLRFARVAPPVSETGQGWKSTLHNLNAQSRVYQPANVRALSHLWRVRLVDEPELSLVFHNVRRVHLRRCSRQFDVAAGSGYHGITAGWIFEGCHHG